MSILAGALKVSALAVALSCVGVRSPTPDGVPLPKASDLSSPKLQCRLYFGCAPAGRATTTIAQQQEYVR
jgi:hypothetical protein